jgi:hypothetical protein
MHGTPAAMLAGPVEEMAAFMIAHLQQGAYQGARILDEATARQMQATQYTYHPEIAGQAFGFLEHTSPGRPRTLYHAGSSGGRYNSLLFLLPEESVGVYLAQNADDGNALGRNVYEALMDRRYPRDLAADPEALPAPPADFEERAGAYTGVYRFGEYWHTTVSKLLILEWTDYPRVTAPGDGTLEVQFSEDQDPFQYVPIDGDLFGLVNYPEVDSRRLVFLRDGAGRVTGFSFTTDVHYEKVPWHGRLWLHKTLFVFFAALFVAAAIGGRIAARRTRRQPAFPNRLGPALAATVGLLNAAALAGLYAVVNLDPARQTQLFDHTRAPWPAVTVAVVLLIASALAGVALVLAIPVWRKRAWTAWGRALYTAFVGIAVAFVPFLGYWNLLGFQW